MLTEMLVAAVILITILGATLTVADPARSALVRQPMVSDLQQRLRGTSVRLRTALMEAGGGPRPGATVVSLSKLRAPIIPARVGDRQAPTSGATFSSEVVTVLSATPERPAAALASALAGRSPVVALTPDPVRCLGRRRHIPTCGFSIDDLALLFDPAGRSDIVRLTAVDDTTLQLRGLSGGAPLVFGAGDAIVPVTLLTYYFDRRSSQLRVQDGRGSDFPVVDDVAAFSVRWFGRSGPPVVGRSGGAVAPCLQALAAPVRASRFLPPDEELDAAVLSDGPWCGGRLLFDVDLFRVRRVTIELRLQVSDAGFRGGASRWFVNPGHGRSGRTVPDLRGVIEVSPPAAPGR